MYPDRNISFSALSRKYRQFAESMQKSRMQHYTGCVILMLQTLCLLLFFPRRSSKKYLSEINLMSQRFLHFIWISNFNKQRVDRVTYIHPDIIRHRHFYLLIVHNSNVHHMTFAK